MAVKGLGVQPVENKVGLECATVGVGSWSA